MSGFGMIAGQAMSEGMGLAFQGARDKLQESHIRNVNAKNWELEKEKHNWYTMQSDLQREKYDHNYNVGKLQEAGLNVGLMYSGGAGGAGGATQPIKGGEPGAAHSPHHQLGKNMAIEAATAKAQIELANAQAEKLKAEKGEIEERTPTHGVNIEKLHAEIGKLLAETGNTELDSKLKEADVELTKLSETQGNQDDWDKASEYNKLRLQKLGWETQKLQGEAESALTQGDIDQSTKEVREQTVRLEFVARQTQIALALAGIRKSNQEIKKMASEMINKLTELELEGRRIDVAEKQMIINGVLGAAGIATGAVQAGRIAEAMKTVETIETTRTGKDGKPRTTTTTKRRH